MSPLIIIVLLFVCYCDSVSLRTVSDKKVTKDATGDFYPDWVPFKNKHGEELGEFKPVPKAKPKKRLALPVNFVLKAVVEPSGDDYYDKGTGESDNEDYYEKKEWSDLNRNAKQVDPDKVINMTSVDTTDIDGIVNIINSKPSPVIESILRRNNVIKNDPPKSETEIKKSKEVDSKEEEKKEIDYSDKEIPEDSLKEKKQVKESVEEDEEKENDEETTQNPKKDDQKPKENKESDEEAIEDIEEPKKKESQLSEQERRENEEKKARILSSVDDLKARHAQEQRAISERVKEEELFREEHERDTGRNSKYSQDISNEKPKWEKVGDYDEYEEDSSSAEDKYKIIPEKTTSTTVKPTRRNSKRRKNKSIATGKLSVFKNPQLYVAYDDSSEETTTKNPEITTKSKKRKFDKFSSRYSVSKPQEEENTRISLVPEDNSKSDEPTLFYPKKRKNRRRLKTTTEPTDSYIAESVSDDEKTDITAATALGINLTGPEKTETTAADITAPSTVDVSSSASNTAPSASDSAPSGLVTAPSAPDAIKSASDSHHASTKKKEKKPENYEFERGGAHDHHAEHDDEHIEHGKKAYEGVHKERKTAKGHHDKEDHLGKYDDHGGVDKHHHDESGHYGSHHHEEHGKKHAKYEESGKHSKGHSTKGSHDIHKKEEYEKRVEFFEEEGDSDEEENHGGHHNEKAHKKGGQFKTGKLRASHEGHDKGESGHFAKGGHGHKHQGHRAAAGHDQHGKHGHGHHSIGGKESGKKWVYHHGHPAKTANLVIIDRRADKYSHGPQYYG